MKYQLGDKVLLLHSNEEAEIIEIINAEMVMVAVEGVSFPVYTDQIDFPYFKRFTESNKEKVHSRPKIFIDALPTEKSFSRYAKGEGMWLALIPVYDKDVFEDDVVQALKIYLVNQTKEAILFSYSQRYQGELDFELEGEILALSDFYLHDIPYESLNDSPRLDFTFSLQKPHRAKAEYFETSIKIKPRQVFMRIEEIRKNQEAYFSYPIFDQYPERAIEEKAETGRPLVFNNREGVVSSFISTALPPRTVIDLHIEKLAENSGSMSNAEKLHLQISTFEKYYDLALVHHQNMLIVVHGVGTGKLRDEIHEILRHKKEVKTFVNQFHPSFGYGATEIYFLP